MVTRDFLRRQNYILLILLLLLVGVASCAIYYQRIMTVTDNDFSSHILYAQDLLAHQPLPSLNLSHPIWQFIISGFFWITRGRINLWIASILALTISNCLLSLIIYFWLGHTDGKYGDYARFFWSLSLPFVAPIIGLATIDNRFYFGYIGLANYHNPTILILRPVALLSFIVVIQIFKKPRNQFWLIAVSAFLTILSALIKPNYIICLVPALFLLMIYCKIKNIQIDWKLAIYGVIAPALIVLAIQIFIAYLSPASGGYSILFLPFVVESAYSGYLPIKFLLSIIFPLAVSLLFIRRIISNKEFQLGWLSFMIAVFQLYLLAESGKRLLDGNFRWSAQITLFILFVISARFIYLQWGSEKGMKKKIMALIGYTPHIISGLIYYIYCFISIHYS